jgi:hypothetical protein
VTVDTVLVMRARWLFASLTQGYGLLEPVFSTKSPDDKARALMGSSGEFGAIHVE